MLQINPSTEDYSYHQGEIALPKPFPLHHGGQINQGQLAFNLYGDLHAPTVLVLGGISANRDVAHQSEAFGSGWWQELAGKNCAIDTEKFSVLAIDYLGGNGASSSPDDEFGTPQGSISTNDQACAIAHLLEELKIQQLFAAIGSSYGGMVVLSLLQHFPDKVNKGLVISAADKAHPQSSGLRFLQRQIVQHCGDRKGLELARALAMLTYRSKDEFEQRFDNHSLLSDQGYSSDLTNYLMSRGKKFAQQFSSEAFLRLSESIDLHRVQANKIKSPLTCVSVTSDQLIPAHTIEAMANQCGAEHISMQSLYGHDAFLKETDKFNAIIKSFLTN